MILTICFSFSILGQQVLEKTNKEFTIKGKVMDKETKEELIGVKHLC